MKDQHILFLSQPGQQDYVSVLNKINQSKEVLGIIIANQPGDYRLNVTSDHQVGRTYGRVVIRGIAANGANLVVNGLVGIKPNAQEVDDFLEMKMLVLDDKSQAIAKPELEIEANSVKASHAATVGQIDKEQLFYLASRGIPKETAEKIIVNGFLRQVVDMILDEDQKQKLVKMLE